MGMANSVDHPGRSCRHPCNWNVSLNDGLEATNKTMADFPYSYSWFMPFSPRWLMNNDREEEASQTLAYLRNLPEDHELVRIELLEIKAEVIFERQVFAKQFPSLANGSSGILRREAAQYTNIFRSRDSFKRVAIGSLVMFFQQWSGIDSSKSLERH